MNNRFAYKLSLGGIVGLALTIGCASHLAQQDQTPPVVQVATTETLTNILEDPSPPILFTAAPPTSVVGLPLEVKPATTNVPEPMVDQGAGVPLPPEVSEVSPAAAEIVKLAQSGVGEEVMLKYIENTSHGFNLNADAIVHLNDLGVSAKVLTAMIERDKQFSAAGGAVPLPVPVPAIIQTQMVSNVPNPINQPVVEQVPPPPLAVQPTYASQEPPVPPPAQDPPVAYFYDSLAPYGSWMYVGGYGWCWQPTAAVGAVAWRPYCDGGSWYWSDCGWYWRSSYSWGWAPFHYGRWFHHRHNGWIWCPGTVWGPAWVSWRYTDGFCGWAPLPPAAVWTMGVGFTYHGIRVGVGCDFGLGLSHHVYVPTARFCDPHLRQHCESPVRLQSIHQRSTVVNNYVIHNTTVVNRGIGRDRISRQVGDELRTVSIRDRVVDHPASMRSERMVREGTKLVVDRPVLPKTPPQIRTTVGRSGAMNLAENAGGARSGSAAPFARSDMPLARTDRQTHSADNIVTRSQASATQPTGISTPPAKVPASIEQPSTTGSFVPNKPEPRNLTPRKSQVAPRTEPRVAPAPSAPSRLVSPTLPKESPRMETPSVTPPVARPSNLTGPRRLESGGGASPVYSAPSLPLRSSSEPPAKESPRLQPMSPPASIVRPSTPTAPSRPESVRSPASGSSAPSGTLRGPSQPLLRESPRTTTMPSAPVTAGPATPAASVRSAPVPAPAPAYTAPVRSAPSYSPPAPRSAPPVSAPSYSTPAPRPAPSLSAPSYSAPAPRPAPAISAPSYSAPAPRSAPPVSAPSYSAPSSPRSDSRTPGTDKSKK